MMGLHSLGASFQHAVFVEAGFPVMLMAMGCYRQRLTPLHRQKDGMANLRKKGGIRREYVGIDSHSRRNMITP